jgi:Holliday junction resolvase
VNRGSAFGAAKEREVMEIFVSYGWWVGRSAGSHGSADLVCLKAGEPSLLVQVKGGDGNLFKGFGPRDRMQLKADAAKAGAFPMLCRWRKESKSWLLIAPQEWPPDTPARHQPDYYVEEGSGCWIWMKARTADGYGLGCRTGRTWLMHRFYYEQHIGPIPEGLQLDHLCSVRACVNPDHLEPVTQIENHLRGRLTRLTAGQVNAIRTSDEAASVLAERHGIGRGYVWRIRTGQARKDVPLRKTAA